MGREQCDHVDEVLEQWHRERPDLDSSPVGVMARLRRASDFLHAGVFENYERFGLGEGEFDILATLRRGGAPFEQSPKELAAQTMVTSGATSKRLDRLVERGLVARRAADGDGRAKLAALTDAGRTLIDAAYPEHLRTEDAALAPLDEAERRQLATLLRKLLLAYEAPPTSAEH